MLVDSLAEKIHAFWFGEIGENGLCDAEKSSAWFEKDDCFDRLMEREFGNFLSSVHSGALDGMDQTPRGALSLIVLTDQFPRNIHRGRPESFAFDSFALAVCRKGIGKGFDSLLAPPERVFFYLPLMHSESFAIQKISVKTFTSLAEDFREIPEVFKTLNYSVDFARRHFDIIEQFGRYPHRNKILGRESTPEEIEFLKQPGSSF